MHNAAQLVTWCRHFISSNYIAFSKRPEWTELSSADLDHMEEHRWPPVDYLNEVKEYEKKITKRDAKAQQECVIM